MSLAENRKLSTRPGLHVPPYVVYAGLTLVMTLALLLGLMASMSVWTLGAFVALPFFAITAVWVSGGAATALMGVSASAPTEPPALADWTPSTRTAILVTLCGEAPEPVARQVAALSAALERAKLGPKLAVFVLSDTSGDEKIAAEQDAFRGLATAGSVHYRRRSENTGRKPGNIADWFDGHGKAFDFMVVLDADSRMTVARLCQMISQMEHRPDLGLLQSGIALIPGTTRFGRHQRVSARLLSSNFGRGFAAWTGECGNYWGHNAIIRTAAFRLAARLPRLSGAAPFGGDLLSHDFIEAAWIRRAGWSVALDPEVRGSAEDTPQTLAAFHRRDRRWCQGNLQHLRLLGAPGLAPMSRVHLASGVLGYLVSPAWLILICLIAMGAVQVTGPLALLLVVLVLILPKLCALVDWLRRAPTPWRCRVALRAWGAELVVSSVIAPLVMLRQVGAVIAVCLGRDCGWKTGRRPRIALPKGSVEAVAGLTLATLAWLASGPAALWLAPVALPLCAAPLIIRALDTPV